MIVIWRGIRTIGGDIPTDTDFRSNNDFGPCMRGVEVEFNRIVGKCDRRGISDGDAPAPHSKDGKVQLRTTKSFDELSPNEVLTNPIQRF